MKTKIFYAISLAVILAGLIYSLQFTLSTANQPWFYPRLCIDGESYIKGMFSITRNNDFLNLKDIYHSPGYQIYLAALYTIFPYPHKIFAISKIIYWILYGVCIVLIFYLGEKYFCRYCGALAAVLLAWSAKFHAYINLLQPAVLMAFLILVYVLLLLSFDSQRQQYQQAALLLLSGIIASLICLIHVRYIFIPLLGCLSIYAKSGKLGGKEISLRKTFISLAVFLAPFVLIFIGWSIYQSITKQAIIIGQGPCSFAFNLGNNPNARGFAYPHVEIIEPKGLRFIVTRPFNFLWLVKQRFLYMWDLKKDIWYIEGPMLSRLRERSGIITIDLPFYFLSLILFLTGCVMKLKSDLSSSSLTRTSVFYLTLLATFISPLLIFGSSRFLIPSLPLIVLLQAYAVIHVVRKIKND